MSVLHHVGVTRFEGMRTLYFESGMYVAATDGAFEIDATRNANGQVELWQVERTTHGVEPIRQITAPARVRFGAGLPRFFELTVRNAAGDTVLSRTMPYCLSAGFGFARVDASGPDQPTYPYGCGGRMTRGDLWGIDQGWADGVIFDLPFAGPDGTYTLTLNIAPTYVDQLQIPADATTASITLSVKTHSSGCIKCPPPVAIDSQSATTDTTTATGEGPTATTAGPTHPTTLGGTGGLQHLDGVPDLRALPAHSLRITHNRRTGRDYLDFGATIWNGGSGPLVLEGFREGSAEVMDATQFIYRDGQPVSSKVIGQFEYDNRRGHQHWHMEDVAQYDLLSSSGDRLVLSSKQSFCLAPTDEIDLTLPGAEWQPDRESLWSACAGESSIWLREVLPAGWGDTYYQSVAGQSFNITNLANGTYKIRITVDPNNRLEETSYDNNVGVLTIKLGGTPGHRTVSVVG